MTYQAQPVAPFLKGVVASSGYLAQPKGSIPRASNLLQTVRGALATCDGSGILNWYNGAIRSTRGRFMSMFLYEPTGVQPYYLALAVGLDQPLGAPENLSETLASGGSLPTGVQQFYKVTALDGAGGETTASAEVNATPSGGNLSVTLTWNAVPNAYAYNIYRGLSTGNEKQLVGAGVPVPQPSPITATVSFTDTGTAVSSSYTISSWSKVVTGLNKGFFFITVGANSIALGQSVVVTGTGIDGTYTINSIFGSTVGHHQNIVFGPASSGTGGTISGGASPPVADTTRQTVLYKMPFGTYPVSYTDANIVAYFPACPTSLGGNPGGVGQQNSTPSGGILGMVSMIPMMRQFVNRVVMAMGNGFPPQLYWDSTGSAVNPAPNGAITGIAVDANGIVTVTTSATVQGTDPTQSGFLPVGSNVVLAGITNSLYNGTYVVLSNASSSTFTFQNVALIGQGSSSGGTWTVSTTPIISTFVPAFPPWAASTLVNAGDVLQPLTQTSPPIYITAVQGGTTAATEPTWPTGGLSSIGQQVPEASPSTVVWEVSGLLNSAAPPPPGAGHIEIYSGALWVFNTSPGNTANGLDGPCALRMSSINNPNSWNPVNQAFLDKDDGSEGMGLAKFTISALGIPPEGSLIAFKFRVPYQIIGVFGATNFAIQPVTSDMGCLAPRSIQFVPGYGITRWTHLGIAIFNGFKDELISEPIRPYLFASNDSTYSDISPVDPSFVAISWSSVTPNPAMYCFLAPIGTSNGVLTRAFCFDLVLKDWGGIVDFPFGLGCMSQVQPVTATSITLLGGFSDGAFQRWQSGDVAWYANSGSPIAVTWSFRTATLSSQNSAQRLYLRDLFIRGITSNTSATTITTSLVQGDKLLTTQSYPLPVTGGFETFNLFGFTGARFYANISGTGQIEIDGLTWEQEPRPIGVPLAAI